MTTPTAKLTIRSWDSRRLGHWVAVCQEYPDLVGAGKTRMAARLDLENQIASLHG
jgi:hypothetical protein